ncbi:hypothetical protein [Enterococcus sp. AZ196]|uniref:hypothetical protein n=1 Tax=Enterococcus sp. AZ196 TaxID=2774659 RepID=UPI003D28A6FC
MITKDVVAFIICALFGILGAFKLALFDKRPCLPDMLTVLAFSGGSLVFFYYYFEGFESPFVQVAYFTIIIGTAILMSKFKTKWTN